MIQYLKEKKFYEKLEYASTENEILRERSVRMEKELVLRGSDIETQKRKYNADYFKIITTKSPNERINIGG